MSEQIYIFNPEHDLCIANGDENFVPPRSAVGFAKENIDLSEWIKRPNRQRRKIIPWGWNHALKKRLINEGIDFIGYSLFESRNGDYSRNILARNEDIEDMIAEYISHDKLTAVREGLTGILTDTLTGHYEGFLGVDQMICQADSPIFVTVSEINLRMTMGLVARNQYVLGNNMANDNRGDRRPRHYPLYLPRGKQQSVHLHHRYNHG